MTASRAWRTWDREAPGHYVKMVHNGIEYGDMQLIAEVYDLLSRGAGLTAREIGDVFAEWNEGELRSYLVEITASVLAYVDAETGTPLVDLILDEAQQKGTGKWMSQNAFDIGAAIPTVNAAVEARLLSALKKERVAASEVLHRAVAVGGPRRTDAGSSRRRDRPSTRSKIMSVRAGDGDVAAGIGRVRLRHRSGHGGRHLAGGLHHPRDAALRHPRRLPARCALSRIC